MAAKCNIREVYFLTAGVHMPILNHLMAPTSFSECQVYKPAVFNLVGDKYSASPIKNLFGGMGGNYKCWWTLNSRMNNVYNALLSIF